MTVGVSPSAAGSFSSQLNVSSSNGGSHQVSLSGDAYVRVPVVGLSLQAWAAGKVATGKSAVSPAITVSNTGEVPAQGLTVNPPAGVGVISVPVQKLPPPTTR